MIKELDYQALDEPTAAAVDNVFASDGAVPEVVRASLAKHVVELLENVPDCDKNWRPQSDKMVLELVDPSLYPLVYGRTRILTEGTRAKLANWKEFLSSGTPAIAPPASLFRDRRISRKYVSDRFQLLPADFAVDTNGKKDPLVPAPPEGYEHARNAYTPYNLRGRTLKVITRLTSMRVLQTGASPRYRGEWGVAGKASEAIVATAAYIYDRDNIEEAFLSFEGPVRMPEYGAQDCDSVEKSAHEKSV
ncbi:hypothetical protein GGF32_003869 [Allomyces javanicus]|nr:hypothetical protein GGF32_003869 [Allomyces javanicus]